MSTKFTVEKIVQSFAIIFFLTSCSFEYSSNSNTQATPSLVGVQNQVNTNSKNSNNLPSKTLPLKTHPVVNYKSVFDNAIMTANMASTLDAKHENDRKLIIDLYKESINSLKKIPSEDQFYKIAQTKIEEYQRKKDNALNSRLTRNHNHIDNQKDKVVKNSIVQSKPKVVVSKATPEDYQLNMQQKLTNFLEDTLDKIVNKNYSFGVYWCDQTKDIASALFNPFGYEILDLMAYSPPYNDEQMVGSAKVRIQSTNRGGQPIINVWNITLGREKRNTDIRKKGDYCIINLYDDSP